MKKKLVEQFNPGQRLTGQEIINLIENNGLQYYKMSLANAETIVFVKEVYV